MNNQNIRITINHVADEAQVSKKTVSRVINNEPNVSERTRKRVQETIARLNYFPDPQARGLASSRSFLLAMIYDNPNPEFVTEAMLGILASCQKKGYELVVHPCLSKEELNIDSILTFIQRIKIDGVILLPPMSESPLLIEALRAKKINYVRLLSNDNEFPENLVQFDDQNATKDVVAHLIKQGHTKIGFIKGAINSESSERRFSAFIEAIAANNIELPEGYIQQGSYTFQSGLASGLTLLQQRPRPTAIFACNDEMALGVIAAANKLNVDIPEDLALVGFDDSPHSSEVVPPLTTVNLQVKKMAGLAADKLLYICENNIVQAAKIPCCVTSELIIRGSSSSKFADDLKVN
ncbi:LacI family DNA-binding transcriptional regulator [Paraglaciecola marina]|uniref:LacI family DNA-binding transcriptional regulator n=1 Tax=Paraglaciecola marina TaxID=2500157 RepID=UPI00105F7BD4|nr:LacI family DNA-binding transcriptional regulator [Paraglaciecola marina]